MMVALPKILTSHRREILDAAHRHGVRTLRVFGSCARGDADANSDIDLLIDMVPGRSLLDQVALWQELSGLLNREVDLLDEAALHGAMRERVLREAVEL